jgi:hypothetical protein
MWTKKLFQNNTSEEYKDIKIKENHHDYILTKRETKKIKDEDFSQLFLTIKQDKLVIYQNEDDESENSNPLAELYFKSCKINFQLEKENTFLVVQNKEKYLFSCVNIQEKELWATNIKNIRAKCILKENKFI